MYVCVHLGMYVCMYVCVFVDVCVYVSLYVCECVCVRVALPSTEVRADEWLWLWRPALRSRRLIVCFSAMVFSNRLRLDARFRDFSVAPPLA